MKKIISLTIAALMIVFAVIGCSADNEQQSAEPTGTVISNSEQQNIESTPAVTPSASASPTPSASPSVSSSPSPTATTSKTGNGVNGKDGKNGTNGQDGADGQNGADGQDGANGSDGQTPYIGSNGNWWIGNTDTGVSATGQGTSGSMGTPIADIAVGTKFPCYPNKEFDWVTDDGISVHISSIDIELTDKESIGFDKWVSDPNYRKEIKSKYSAGWGSGVLLEKGIAYKLTTKIEGNTDSSLSGSSIWVAIDGLCLPYSEGAGIYAKVNQDGSFTITDSAFFADGNSNVQVGYWVRNCAFKDIAVYQSTPTPTPTPELPIVPDVDVLVNNANRCV